MALTHRGDKEATKKVIWSVPKSWAGETCVILAGGSSLRGFHALSVYGSVRVITINDSWRIAPWADVHYFHDAKWWDDQVMYNRRSIDGTADFADMVRKGFWVNGAKDESFRDHSRIHTLKVRQSNCRGLEKNPSALAHGANSGYQAINLAYHFGAKRIMLLGYDMHVNGRSHWHDEARPQWRNERYPEIHFLPHFDGSVEGLVDGKVVTVKPSLVDALKAEGVDVVNCTPGSALKCWPYLPLDEALSRVRALDQG